MELCPCHRKVQKQIHFSPLVEKLKGRKKIIDFTVENNFGMNQNRYNWSLLKGDLSRVGEWWLSEQKVLACKHEDLSLDP